MKKYLIVLIVLGGLGILGLLGMQRIRQARNNNAQTSSSQTTETTSGTAATTSPTQTTTPTTSTSPATSPTTTPTATASTLNDPIAQFKTRITKKFFGTYVTPQNSPVSPEKFTGYHTGVDVEYGDVTSQVDVYAIANGKVVLSRFASGYGGLTVLQLDVNGKQLDVVYGHLAPQSMLPVGTNVVAGQTIGYLGKAYSSETDGERRHLHFGILKDTSLNIKGYVQTKAELASWYDPLTFYP